MLVGGASGSRGTQLPWYWSVIGACAIAVIMSVIAPTREALAATFTVTQIGDAADANVGDGVCDVDAGTAGNQCSLRAAVQTANNLGGSHIINLPAGTYTLSVGGRGENAAAGGDLDITANVTVRSSDNAVGTVTIDANDLDRIFEVRSGGTLTVIGLTVTDGDSGGDSGGAIYSDGTMTLIGTTVSSSAAANGGGIFVNAGTTTLHASVVTGNSTTGDGGAIFVDPGATLELYGSTLSSNSASNRGGGLSTSGTTDVANSTIHDNDAGAAGGVIVYRGSLTMNRVTISDNETTLANQPAGGVYAWTQGGNTVVNLTNTTFSGNASPGFGGALAIRADASNSNTVTLTNTTIGVNTATTNPTTAGIALVQIGTLTLNVQNSVFDSACGTVFGSPTVNDQGGNRRTAGTNCPGTDATLDLGALADNGGFTQTVAIGAASSAIDAATANCPPTDQRGVVRTSTCDSGAFERTAVNQPPVISAIPNQTLDEDQPTGPVAFQIADSDTPGGAGLSLSISGNTASTIIPNGSYTFLGSGTNRALRGTPNADANGSGTVTVQVTDAGSVTATSAFTLTYNAVNDAPTFNALGGNPPASNEDGGAQTVNTFTAGMARGPATATDESGQTLTFNLSQTATTGGLTFATAPAIDSSTGALTYTASAESSGTATYSVTLSDNGGTSNGGANTSAVQSFTITVNIVNDAPTAPSPQAIIVAENTPRSLALVADLGWADVDSTLPPATSITTITPPTDGSLGSINLAAGSLTYTPNAGYNGPDSFQIQVCDTGTPGSQCFTQTVDVTVTAVNSPPVNTVPATQNTSEDTQLVFSTGNGNAISVADPDAASADIQTTLTVDSGTLAFATGAPTAALTTATGSGTNTLTLVGTATEISAALQGMVFTPVAGSSGTVILTVTTNDLGNTGTGGPLQDVDTVSILVNSVNDPPVNTVPAAQTTPANTPLVFSMANGNAISVADPDAGAATTVQVTLSVPASVGALTRGPSGQAAVTGNGTHQVQLTGSLANLNADLQGLTFTPQSNVTGITTLTVATNDAGNSGGAPLQDTDPVQITVLALPSVAINDASVLEGDSGARNLQYTVSLSAASNLTVTAQYATANGTATGAASCVSAADYQTTNGTVTFSPGETSKTISVSVCGDAAVEPDETVLVTLSSPVNASIGDGQATGAIRNDDQGGAVTFSAATATVNENGGSVTLTVQRSGGPTPAGSGQGNQRGSSNGRVQPAALGAVSVQYATSDGTAAAGRDYTATSGTLSFGVDETTRMITVPIRDDSDTEPNETFTVTLANPTGGAAPGSPSSVTVTIVDTSVPASPLQGQDDTDPSRKNTQEHKDVKETDEQRQNREQTNRSNRDDIATEGNVIAVNLDASPPTIVIGNRDGEVTIILNCGDQCPTIRLGDYVEVDGAKVNEQLYEAEQVTVTR